MKISRKEFAHEYATYRFGYCEYAEIETGDDPRDIYELGFLPYSADPKVQGSFYMARSARVALDHFSYTSENRRIGRFFDGTFSRRVVSQEEMLADERIQNLFLTYFAERHGTSVMPKERLEGILRSPLPLRGICYEKDGALIAVVFEIMGEDFGHFWFSAYDLTYVHQSLGMWLMLDCAQKAKEAGLLHYYLGTVYGEKALYKTNLEPLEYWDGAEWSSDISTLKELARTESLPS